MSSVPLSFPRLDLRRWAVLAGLCLGVLRLTASEPSSAEFVRLESGAFEMGNAVTAEGFTDELPVHTVTTRAFYIGKTPITWLRWRTVRDWAVTNGSPDLADTGAGKADDHPVIGISWNDAVKWCNAASRMEGLTEVYYTDSGHTQPYRTGSIELTSAMVAWTANGYRLPTETEWERAARGGLAGQRFPNGMTLSHLQANYVGSARFDYDVSGATEQGPASAATGVLPWTSPVGSLAANDLGLHDMAGNVWEWCWDRYSADAYAHTLDTDPSGPDSGAYRVIRGGSWDEDAEHARVSHREADLADRASYGLRVVRSVAGAVAPPSVDPLPTATTIVQGRTLTLTATASGVGPFTYQWTKNGVAIPGATEATFSLNMVHAADAGEYAVVVTNAGGSVMSAASSVSINTDPGRIVNLSVRTHAGTGDRTLIMGFVLRGAGTKPFLFRGMGPSLASFGVSGILADPGLTIFDEGRIVASNSQWGGDPQLVDVAAAVGAFPFMAPDSADAAIYDEALPAGVYTAQITGGGGTTGIALAEIYDASGTADEPVLVNVSSRAEVGVGDQVLIVGFVVSGTTPVTVLVRGVGPALTAWGVSGVLANPKLELYKTAGDVAVKVAENDDWGGDATLRAASATVGAMDLSDGGTDAAVVVTLDPGVYSAVVSGVDNTSGVALAEVYLVPE